MARRLVEAGVELITTTFDGPLCGRVANWDDHAVNHHVFDALAYRLPVFDQAVTALIEDIYDRGLDRRVLVVVTGEFGRTPRISYVASSGGGVASGAGTVQPGRDHWPAANSMLFAGGGIRTGQVIGGTDRRGEEVVERRMGVDDFLATVYRHLGIDASRSRSPTSQAGRSRSSTTANRFASCNRSPSRPLSVLDNADRAANVSQTLFGAPAGALNIAGWAEMHGARRRV